MQILIKKIIVSGIILLLLDGIFVNFYMREYEDQIALVQRVVMQVNPIGAFLSYFILIFGLNFFIIDKNRSVLEAFIFGLVTYGVYDATNYATLKRWDPYLAMIDTLWGGILMSSTTYLTYIIVHL